MVWGLFLMGYNEPMDAATFQREYKRLNKAQQQAVDAIEGPVMVIAGPGTGKTQTLTLRIANILLKTDTMPENILALTFTESGAHSMRKRLVEIIGSPAYRVNIMTFHSFCQDLIITYPDEFPRIIGGTSATDVDRIAIVERVLEKGGFNLLRPYGDVFFYVRSILGAIQHLKREGIAPDVFTRIVEQSEDAFNQLPDLYHEKGAHKGKMKGAYLQELKDIEKTKELARAYQMYQEEIEADKKYDYEDMIIEAVRAMERNSDFLLGLQENYQYILADEHQDTNNAQNRILELLASFHEDPNLFIVGDEKQAIFRFQGASLANFLYFKDKFPSALIITLTENYRSRQDILDAAHSVILHNRVDDKTLHAPLVAKKEAGPAPILLSEFSSPEYEYFFLVDDIRKKISDGVPPEEIAIFYRDNNDAHTVLRYLEKSDIPFIVLSDRDLLSDQDLRKLIALLRAVEDLGDDTVLAAALYIDFLGIPNIDVHRVISHARKERIPLYGTMKSKKVLEKAGVEAQETILRLAKNMAGWGKLARNRGLLETLEVVVRESGFLHSILAEVGGTRRMETLEGFFTEAERAVLGHREYLLRDFLEYIAILERHGVLVKMPHRAGGGGVRLMTAHKAKGLEFDYVYAIGVYDKHWGGRRSRTSFRVARGDIALSFEGEVEDERRLFYVLLTRARKGVSLSYSSTSIDGRHQLPSQFVGEIDVKLIRSQDVGEFEAKYQKEKERIFAPRINQGPEIADKKYLQELFLEQGLSITAVNNYLRCPWEYFFVSLVRIPRPYSKFQMYGTVIHRILKEYYDALRAGESPTESFLEERLAGLLGREPLSATDFTDLLAKGKRALLGYYKAYKHSVVVPIATEFSIAGPYLTIENSGEPLIITLRGVIDKIEEGDGGINVVDYKTSKPRSRNAIEGKTKSSDGEYKRQLVFYKYLLDRYDEGKYKMETGEIDFVEPDDKGRFKKERFVISQDEVDELVREMKRIGSEIYSLAFWDKTCGKKDCDYCALRATMKPQ